MRLGQSRVSRQEEVAHAHAFAHRAQQVVGHAQLLLVGHEVKIAAVLVEHVG